MQLYSVLLTAGTTQSGSSSIIFSVVSMGALFLIMYFIMIRPQKKKEKETQSMRKSIQIGDEVITVGGIVGIVVKLADDTVVIETGGDRSKIRVKLWAIQSNETIHDAPEA